MQRWQVGGWTITRVADPGFELVLAQDDETRARLKRSRWLYPRFVTDEWALRVGSSAIVLANDAYRVIVDPWLAFDDPARFSPRLEALAAAGWSADDIDIVINSHIDGVGANVDPVARTATFPHARYLVPGIEMTALASGHRSGAEGLLEVERAGLLDRYDDGIEPAAGLVLDPLPGHNPGHYGVYVGDPPAAVVVGHLFLHPAQIANPDVADLDHDPPAVRATRRCSSVASATGCCSSHRCSKHPAAERSAATATGGNSNPRPDPTPSSPTRRPVRCRAQPPTPTDRRSKPKLSASVGIRSSGLSATGMLIWAAVAKYSAPLSYAWQAFSTRV